MFALARRLAVFVVIFVVVALAFWAGAYHLHERAAAVQLQKQNEVVLTKDDPNAQSDAGIMGAILRGKPAPAFTLVDLNGKKVSLADFKGHPVVVNFWATYCGPCKLEMPWFQEMVGRYGSQGLIVLGLDQDEGTDPAEITKAAKKTGVSYPILLPDDKVAKAYQLGDYLPETYYIGKDGTVVEQTVGVNTKDELEADVKKIVGGQ
jgi:thiol-disulfide isomerase/thioredoxin